MGGFFDPSLFARTYRDPVVVLGLTIDLLPLIAIFGFGWGIDELVVFYWMENVVIGAAVWLRMAAAGVGGRKPIVLFLIPFFTVHYGIFCAVHGMFIMNFFDPAFNALPLFLAAIIFWEGVLFALFIIRKEHQTSDPNVLLFSPYARVVIVHLAIFAAAFTAGAFGSPIGGAIAILLMDVTWGVLLSVYRRKSRDKFNQEMAAA